MEYQYNDGQYRYPQPSSVPQHDLRHAQPGSVDDKNDIMPDMTKLRPTRNATEQHDGYTSDSSRYSSARQPINDAIASTLNTSDAAAAAAIPPDLIDHLATQITANVLQRLRSTNIPVPTGTMNVPIDTLSSSASSPPLDRATVYTPPSPYRASEEAAQTRTTPNGEVRYGQPIYGHGTPPIDPPVISPVTSQYQSDEGEVKDDQTRRPRAPKRVSTTGDATILEKVWGTLFNEHGQATVRLGQFLRGIAVHLIEDYEPKHSLVITPAKLQKYYEDTKVPFDYYPWQLIFDDRTSCISRMFRDFEIEHHLVQAKLNDRPDTPGLTPQGFETWATLMLRAHPDREFERLAKTALDMPISNPDDRKERFPKEISRRLFPKDADEDIASKLHRAISNHCNVKLPSRQNSVASSVPESPRSRTSVPDRSESIITPATTNSSTHVPNSNGKAVEDSDDTPTPRPIERERKPYVATPGKGKNYETSDADMVEQRPAQTAKLARTQSMSGSSRHPRPSPIVTHTTNTASVPVDVPDPRLHRSNSVHHRDHASKPSRHRSASRGKDTPQGRRSEPDNNSAGYQPTSIYEGRDDQRRHREFENQRERHTSDRYDAARMSAFDPRERERDRERDYRIRGMSMSAGYDGVRSPYSADEDYYRSSAGYSAPRDAYSSQPTSSHYPPNSYRETRG